MIRWCQGWVSESQKGISDRFLTPETDTVLETTLLQVSDRNCQYLISFMDLCMIFLII